MRMVILGGEIAHRGLFGGKRNKPENIGLATGVGLSMVLLFSLGVSNPVSVLIVLVVLGVTFALTTPTKWTEFRSLGGLLMETWHSRERKKKGKAVFVPVKDRPQTALVKASKSQLDEADENGMITVPLTYRDTAPLMVGNVRFFAIDTPEGEMVIFRHSGQEEKPYYTATVETMGVPSGLREEFQEDAGYIAHGQLLARLARRQSLISGVQSLSRSVPIDPADHVMWIAENQSHTVPEVLVSSYGQLCDLVQSRAEQHRNYETFRIPETGALLSRAQAYGAGDDGVGIAIYEEISSAMRHAEIRGSIKAFRPLGRNRMAALLRHLQDPEFDIDDFTDTSLEDCWQHLDGASVPRALVVNKRWYTRTGYVPADAFSPEPIPVQALRMLIRGVQPPVIHTVSVIDKLEDARTARGKARVDFAQDKAKKIATEAKGTTTDGAEDVLLNASAQRREDLKNGTGHHGAAFGIYITYQVDDPGKFLATADLIEAAAADAGIELIEWLDQRQDLSLITTMPMTRGIR